MKILTIFALFLIYNFSFAQVDSTSLDTVFSDSTNNTFINTDSTELKFSNLENELIQLLAEVNTYVAVKNKPKSIIETSIDILKKVLALIASIIAILVSYFGLKKTSFFEKYQPLLLSIVLLFFTVALTFIFKEVIFLIVFTFFAIIIAILIALIVVLKYIQHFDSSEKNLKHFLKNLFNMESDEHNASTTINEYRKTFLTSLIEFLNNIKEHQLFRKEYELILPGSLIPGYNYTSFSLIPNETNHPHWKIIDNSVLIPFYIDVLFIKDLPNNDKPEIKRLINIQFGLIVTKNKSNELEYSELDHENFNLLTQSFQIKLQEELSESFKKWQKSYVNLQEVK